MSSELAIVTGYVILNAVLAVPFMLAARADFHVTPLPSRKWRISPPSAPSPPLLLCR